MAHHSAHQTRHDDGKFRDKKKPFKNAKSGARAFAQRATPTSVILSGAGEVGGPRGSLSGGLGPGGS